MCFVLLFCTCIITVCVFLCVWFACNSGLRKAAQVGQLLFAALCTVA